MTNLILSTSRYIAFFDESGDHSLTKIDTDFPLFLLCTVVVEREAYANKIIPMIGAFKLRYFAHEGFNLHSRDIRKSSGPFSFLQNSELRNLFLKDMNELMAKLPFTLFATAIKKDPYIKKYGSTAKNPYSVALEYTFERILHFMESNQATDLPVIAEGRGRQEDDELRASFLRLLNGGTFYNKRERFNNLHCPLSFRKKNDNICGIQLADLCAYPTARHVLKPQENNRAFEVIQPRFYDCGRVNGLKVFP
ncbi:MAG: DUF3800 domain-containing protein [Deltaproteobacteria bacterium]|nr:DUF3800 domain-containing protein [Deltaproteobacteria bacterium]